MVKPTNNDKLVINDDLSRTVERIVLKHKLEELNKVPLSDYSTKELKAEIKRRKELKK